MRGHRVEDLPDDFWIPIPLDTNNITSLSPFLVPQDHLGSKALFYSLSVFMFFLFVTGTSINILTIACTAQYKKLRSHLNYILVNMAVANLIVSIAGSFTCFYCFSSRYMVLGPLGCKIEGFSATLGGKDCIDIDKLYYVTYWQRNGLHWISLTLTYIVNKLHVITFILIVLFSGMVSLWSLAVIAFERWLVICKPLGNFAFKSEHALFFCALTWFFALCAAAPPLVGWSRWAQEHQIKTILKTKTNSFIVKNYWLLVLPGISQRASSVPVDQTGTQQAPGSTLNPMWRSYSASALLSLSPASFSATHSCCSHWNRYEMCRDSTWFLFKTSNFIKMFEAPSDLTLLMCH